MPPDQETPRKRGRPRTAVESSSIRFYVSQSLADKRRQQAAADDTTVSHVVRRLLGTYLEKGRRD